MTWTAQGGNSAGSKVLGGTSFTIGSPGVAAAGDVIIVKVALNNTSTVDADTSPVTSITDALGNTYAALRSRTNANAAAGAGASVAIWACLNSLAGTVGTITINHGALDARGGIAEIFRPSNGNGGSVDATTAINQADAQDPVSFSLTPSGGNIEYLWLYALAAEGPSTDTDTADAANGWTGSGVAGTTGGSGVTNMTVGGGYQVATASSKTCNWVHTASDYVQALVAITENAAAGAGIAVLVAADPNYNGGPRMSGFFEDSDDDDRDFDYQYHAQSSTGDIAAQLFPPSSAFTRSNTAQGGTDGLVPTTGNTGGASGDAFDVVSADGTDSRLRFKDFDSADGGKGYRFVSGSGTIQLQWDASTNPTQLWSRFYLWLAKWPTAHVWPLLLQDDVGGGDQTVGITSTGLLRGTTHAGFTSDGAVPIPQEQWVRIEARVLSNNVASGELEIRLWLNPNSAGAADDTILMTGRQTGNFTDFVSFRSSDGATVIHDYIVDNLAVSDVTWLGPSGTFATGDAPLSLIANAHPTGAEHSASLFDWRPEDAFQAALDASVQSSTDVTAAFNPPAAPAGNTDEELQAIHQQTDPFAGIVWPEPDSTYAEQAAIATTNDSVPSWQSHRLIVWLDTSQLVGVSNDDALGTLPDVSGNANDFTQSDPSLQPRVRLQRQWAPFEQKATVFNPSRIGTTASLIGPDLANQITNAVTMFVVYRPGANTNVETPVDYSGFTDDLRYTAFANNGNDAWWHFDDGQSYFGPWRTSRLTGYPGAGIVPTSGTHLVALVASAAGVYHVYGEYADAGDGSSGFTFDRGGSSKLMGTSPDPQFQERGVTGYFAELRIFNWDMSPAERQAQIDELSLKWLADITPTIYPTGSELPVFDYAPFDFEIQQAAIAASTDVTAAFNPPAGVTPPTDGELAAITQIHDNLEVFAARELQDAASFQAALDAAAQTSASTAGHTAMHTHWPPIEWVRNGGGEWYRLDDWLSSPNVAIVSDGTAHSGDVYFETTGSGQTALADDVFPIVDPLGVTTISGWFRYPGTGNVPLYYFGFVPLDRNGLIIETAAVFFGALEEYTTLTADLVWGDTTIQVADPTIFSATGGRGGNPAIVFNPDTSGAYDDLPNKELFYVTAGSSPLAILYAPAQRAGYGPGQVLWPAGTVVRRHEAGGSFIYSGAAGVFATSSWTLATGTVSGIATPFELPDGSVPKWRIGTVLVRLIILANYQGTLSTTQWDDISVVQPEQSETFLVGQQGALTGRDIVFGDTIALFVQTGGDAKLTHDNQRSVGGRAARFYSGSGFSGSNYASLEGYQYLVPGTDGSLSSDPDQTRLWTRFDFAANQRPPSYLPIWSWNGAGGAAFIELRSDGTLAICNGDDGSVVAGGSVPTNLYDFARVEIKAEKRTATTLAVDLALYLDETSAVPDETLSGVARSNALGIDLAGSRLAIGPTPQRHGGGTDPGFAMWIDELAFSTRGMPATPTRAQATTAAPSDVVAGGPFEYFPGWPQDAWAGSSQEAIDAAILTSTDVTAAFFPPAAATLTDAELLAAGQVHDHLEAFAGQWDPYVDAVFDPTTTTDVAWYLADQTTDAEEQAITQIHDNLLAWPDPSYSIEDYRSSSVEDPAPLIFADRAIAGSDSLAVAITDTATVQAFESIEGLIAAQPTYVDVAQHFGWDPFDYAELDPATSLDVSYLGLVYLTDAETIAATQTHDNLEAFQVAPELTTEDYSGSFDPAPYVVATAAVTGSDSLAVVITDSASVQAFETIEGLIAADPGYSGSDFGTRWDWSPFDYEAIDVSVQGSVDVTPTLFPPGAITAEELQAATQIHDNLEAFGLAPAGLTVEDWAQTPMDPAPQIYAAAAVSGSDSLAVVLTDSATVQAFEGIEQILAAQPSFADQIGIPPVETEDYATSSPLDPAPVIVATASVTASDSLAVAITDSASVQAFESIEGLVAADPNYSGIDPSYLWPLEQTVEDWAQLSTLDVTAAFNPPFTDNELTAAQLGGGENLDYLSPATSEDWTPQSSHDIVPMLVADASVSASDSLAIALSDTATIQAFETIEQLIAAQPSDPQGLEFPEPWTVDEQLTSHDLTWYLVGAIDIAELAAVTMYPEAGTVEALFPPATTFEAEGFVSMDVVAQFARNDITAADSLAVQISETATVQAFARIEELVAADPNYSNAIGILEQLSAAEKTIEDWNPTSLDVSFAFATVNQSGTETLAVVLSDTASIEAYSPLEVLLAAQQVYGSSPGTVEAQEPETTKDWASPSALEITAYFFPPAPFTVIRIRVPAMAGQEVDLSGIRGQEAELDGMAGGEVELTGGSPASSPTGLAGRHVRVVPQSD